MTDELVKRLRSDAEHHKAVADDCDCRPEDTANWQHAINCIAAADRIEALEREVRRLNNAMRHFRQRSKTPVDQGEAQP